MLNKPALILVSALTASLMLGASTAAVGDVQSSEQPTIAIEQDAAPAITAAAEIPVECRLLSPGEWKASVNVQQPDSPKLIVSGEVETSTGGYEVTLERGEINLNPAIVTMELKVVQPPADSMVSQMITPHAVKTEVPDVSRDLKRVVINCGAGKLTEIAEISVLH
ncbi:hypothetical protein ACNSO8_02750 [Yersinia sp. LJYL362]|uniref:hypothetical protein n=1 Tax=Yersinia sp. LJYL362 TaxID=3402108 RepID=UPI003AB1ADF4